MKLQRMVEVNITGDEVLHLIEQSNDPVNKLYWLRGLMKSLTEQEVMDVQQYMGSGAASHADFFAWAIEAVKTYPSARAGQAGDKDQ